MLSNLKSYASNKKESSDRNVCAPITKLCVILILYMFSWKKISWACGKCLFCKQEDVISYLQNLHKNKCGRMMSEDLSTEEVETHGFMEFNDQPTYSNQWIPSPSQRTCLETNSQGLRRHVHTHVLTRICIWPSHTFNIYLHTKIWILIPTYKLAQHEVFLWKHTLISHLNYLQG